jgi:hypothetical protein
VVSKGLGECVCVWGGGRVSMRRGLGWAEAPYVLEKSRLLLKCEVLSYESACGKPVEALRGGTFTLAVPGLGLGVWVTGFGVRGSG